MSSRTHPLLGSVVVEARTAQFLRDSGVQLSDCLARHLDGDLGDTAVTGTLERAALWAEGRVRSSYPIGARRLDIATDLDRGVTVVTTSTRT